MIKFIITYLFAGVIFTVLVDWATNYAKKRGIPVPPEAEFNNETRLFVIVIWPVGLIYFVNGFVKEYFKKNKK